MQSWLPGLDAATAEVDVDAAARDLARFVRELQAVDVADGPPARSPDGRGVPIAVRDELTRRAIEESSHLVDVDTVTEAWDRALAAPVWFGPSV